MKLQGSLDEIHAVHINPAHEGAIARQRPPHKICQKWMISVDLWDPNDSKLVLLRDVKAISVYPFDAYVSSFYRYTRVSLIRDEHPAVVRSQEI